MHAGSDHSDISHGRHLPLLSKFFINTKNELSSKLGALYFINTIGAAAGAFFAGFYLIRILGISATLQCAAVINMGIGALAFYLNMSPKNIYGPQSLQAGQATTETIENRSSNGSGYKAHIHHLCPDRLCLHDL